MCRHFIWLIIILCDVMEGNTWLSQPTNRIRTGIWVPGKAEICVFVTTTHGSVAYRLVLLSDCYFRYFLREQCNGMVKLITYLRLVPRLHTVSFSSPLRVQGTVLKLRASLCYIWSTAQIILHGKKYGAVILKSKVKKVKIKSYPCNRPWRPTRQWDVKDPTLSRQSAQRWR
jgi:hypothetical protein